MNRFLLTLATSIFFLTSCNKNLEDGSSRFTKDVDLPVNPCNLITRDMIICHFGGSSAKLELVDLNNQSNSTFSQCGYIWAKTNHDEIQSYRSNVMLAYASNDMNNNKEVRMSDLMKLESPYNHLKIGQFRKYDNINSAVRDFKVYHRIPSEEDLANEFENNVNLIEVDGVGDQAFYDEENKALNVRYGVISFSVFIETEFDIETNILIATKFANEVWGKL